MLTHNTEVSSNFYPKLPPPIPSLSSLSSPRPLDIGLDWRRGVKISIAHGADQSEERTTTEQREIGLEAIDSVSHPSIQDASSGRPTEQSSEWRMWRVTDSFLALILHGLITQGRHGPTDRRSNQGTPTSDVCKHFRTHSSFR